MNNLIIPVNEEEMEAIWAEIEAEKDAPSPWLFPPENGISD